MIVNDLEHAYQVGFIKVYRSMRFWEWYDDSETVHLFLHIIMSANWKPKRWHGIKVERGQLITSLDSLSRDTGITKKKIRTRLQRLEETGEIGTQRARSYTLITVCKYESYQHREEGEGHTKGTLRAQEGHTEGTQRARTKEYKEYKEGEEESIHDFSVRWTEPDNPTDEQKELTLAVRVYKAYCEIYGKRAYEDTPSIEWIEKVRKIPADDPNKIPDVLFFAKKFNTFGYARAADLNYLVNNWASFRADAERAYLNNAK